MHEPQPTQPSPANAAAGDQHDSVKPVTTHQPSPASGVTDAPPTSTGQRYGRFTLQRFHAKGGLGEVHVALDEELRRDVALKRMQERCANEPSARRRFLNEAEITARLEHPGIVPIHGLVQDEHGQPCYAMRFIQGESLAEAIKAFHRTTPVPSGQRFQSLAFRQLLQRFTSVCQTMAYAHSRHVIHRDLKPANIMLGPFGETLVVDWGLAREIAAKNPSPAVCDEEALLPSTVNFATAGTDNLEYTREGEALGSPAYMSPEQAAGRRDTVGSASDVYSLGATLYEMLTGRPPVQGRNWPEIQQRIQRGEYPKPRRVNSDVPKPLAWPGRSPHGRTDGATWSESAHAA